MNRKMAGCFLVLSIFILFKFENSYGQITNPENDYYLNISSFGTGSYVSLNGFEMINNGSGTMNVSRVITSLLVKGENRLEIFFIPDFDSTINSKLSVEIIATPAGERLSSQKAETIFEQEYKNSRINITSLKMEEDIHMTKGSIDTDNDELTFFKEGERVIWGIRLRDELSFKRVPSRLRYLNLNTSISDVKVIFFNSYSKEEVVFSDLEFSPNMGSIDLDRNKISKGKNYLDGYSFDSMVIVGKVKSDGEIKLYSLQVSVLRGQIHETKVVKLRDIRGFSWTKGEKLNNINNKMKNELFAEVKTLHNALSKRDLKSLTKIFHLKAQDLARVMHKTMKELNARQEDFFKGLFEKKGWELKPVLRNDLRAYLVNEKVVKVESTLNRELIESHELTSSSGKQRTFSIPLYYSRINDSWVLVH